VIDPGRPEVTRLGEVIALPGCPYNIRRDRVTYTAQLERLVVTVAVIEVAGMIRGVNSVWLIDNVAAIMASVGGSSGSHLLGQRAKTMHWACFALRSVPYFEYIG